MGEEGRWISLYGGTALLSLQDHDRQDLRFMGSMGSTAYD